jgi:Glycosyltransferase family 87
MIADATGAHMKRFGPVSTLLLVAYAAFLFWHIAADAYKFQPDLRIYYDATKAWQQGLNPYDPQSLVDAGGPVRTSTYVYPPLSLFVLSPLTLLPFDRAFQLVLGLKYVLVCVLFVLWRRILRLERDAVFPFFCLLAFNGTIYLDVAAGNVSLVEQAVLWAAFACFARGRLVPFCVLVVAASTFKITPLVFLLLLWTTAHRRRHAYLLGSLAGFLAVQAPALLAAPSFLSAYVRNLWQLDEAGIVNPSTAALVESASKLVGDATGFPIGPPIRWALMAGVAAAVLAVSRRSYLVLRTCPPSDRAWQTVFLACFMYALLLPRFKDYSFILLIAPAYSVILSAPPGASRFALSVLAVLSARHLMLPGLTRIAGLVWDYYPLGLAFAFWVLHGRDIRTRGR